MTREYHAMVYSEGFWPIYKSSKICLLVLLLRMTLVDLNWNKKIMVVWNRLELITICSSRTTLTLSSTRVEMLEVS